MSALNSRGNMEIQGLLVDFPLSLRIQFLPLRVGWYVISILSAIIFLFAFLPFYGAFHSTINYNLLISILEYISI